MHLASRVLSLGAALALTACQPGTTAPVTPNAAKPFQVSAAKGPTLIVTKGSGGLVATLTANKTDTTALYDYASQGCGTNKQDPCYVVQAGAGLGQIRPIASAPDCNVVYDTEAQCSAKRYSSITIVVDDNSDGDGAVTLEGGTGPHHPSTCAPDPVFVKLKGQSSSTDAWDGCHRQTITCSESSQIVEANSFDDVRGPCSVTRKPGRSAGLKRSTKKTRMVMRLKIEPL